MWFLLAIQRDCLSTLDTELRSRTETHPSSSLRIARHVSRTAGVLRARCGGNDDASSLTSSTTASRDSNSLDMMSNSERDSRTCRTNWAMDDSVVAMALLTPKQLVLMDLRKYQRAHGQPGPLMREPLRRTGGLQQNLQPIHTVNHRPCPCRHYASTNKCRGRWREQLSLGGNQWDCSSTCNRLAIRILLTAK